MKRMNLLSFLMTLSRRRQIAVGVRVILSLILVVSFLVIRAGYEQQISLHKVQSQLPVAGLNQRAKAAFLPGAPHNGGKVGLPMDVSLEEGTDGQIVKIQPGLELSAVQIQLRKLNSDGQTLNELQFVREQSSPGEVIQVNLTREGLGLSNVESIAVSVSGTDESGLGQSRVFEVRPENYSHPLLNRSLANTEEQGAARSLIKQLFQKTATESAAASKLGWDSQGELIESFTAVQE